MKGGEGRPEPPYSLIFLLTGLRIYTDVMPDRREGITRAAGFGFACIDTQAS